MPLSKKDSALFFDLWDSVLLFTMPYYKQTYSSMTSALPAVPPHYLLVNYFWIHCDRILPAYLQAFKNDLTPEQKEIAEGLSRHISGQFILERITKEGAIFMVQSAQNEIKVFLVKDLISSWKDMTKNHKLPAIVKTTFIPFKGGIITDGLLNYSTEDIIPSKASYELKQIYLEAKKNDTIIRSL
jgi:hypothetical protein